MSDTAQTALAVLCFVLAMSAQLAGIALLAREGRRTSTALRRWRDARAGGSGAVLPGQHDDLDRFVAHLVGDPFDRTSAVVLLVVGVVVGALGHFLAL